MTTDWMEVIESEDPRDRSDSTYKRKRRRVDSSLHRDRKLATHSTVKGKGKIAQLRGAVRQKGVTKR